MQLGNIEFFNLFARLITFTNNNRDCDEWQVDGVFWKRERLQCWGPTSFQIEVHRLSRRTKPGWTFLFIRETWWAANRKKAIRDVRWTHIEDGSRSNILRWFQERQKRLDSSD